MAIWFKHGCCAVGLDDGLVRAGDFAQLIDAQSLVTSAEATAKAFLLSAEAEADLILQQAEEEARAVREQARQLQKRGFAKGFDIGQRKAREEWTQQAVDEAVTALNALERQKKRLRDIVSLAVERVIGQTDRKAIFALALSNLSTLIQEVPLLTLRVHESDHGQAESALADMMSNPGLSSTKVKIVSDSQLGRGSCLFESDRGQIDAGLDTQLAAIRRALAKATRAPRPVDNESME